MTQEKQRNKNRTATRLESRSWKTFLIVLAAFLIFVGPTYIVYGSINILKINYAVSMISGFALFIVGLVLLWYLIKNKIIT